MILTKYLNINDSFARPTMQVTMRSQLTNKEHTMDLPITEAQWKEWNSPGRRMVQDIFPELTAAEREFLLTGITPREWTATFPPGREEE